MVSGERDDVEGETSAPGLIGTKTLNVMFNTHVDLEGHPFLAPYFRKNKS